MTERDWIVYLGDCPSCGRDIREPFVRGAVSYFKHTPSQDRSPCHLAVDIDPLGEDHRVEVARGNERYEDALFRLITREDYWERRMFASFRAVRGAVVSEPE